MLVSQRFPDNFDGILACAPGFQLPKAALFGEVWDTQTLAELAVKLGIYDKDGMPFLNKTFTDEDLAKSPTPCSAHATLWMVWRTA